MPVVRFTLPLFVILVVQPHFRSQVDSGAGEGAESTPQNAGEPAHGMQVEVPYVPAAQRATKQIVEVVDDSIVVVGQARQKKRKRAKTDTGADGDGDGDAATADSATAGLRKTPKKEKRDEGEEVEAFDFGAVPNILDDVPNDEDNRVKRKKKQKQVKGLFFFHGLRTD
jgi:exosome complex exonuclease RRP6